MHAHFFNLTLPEAWQWHGKAICNLRFHVNTDWPELAYIKCHYNQCVKMRI
jgi:hypothetical protein